MVSKVPKTQKQVQSQEAFYSGRLSQNIYWQSTLFNEYTIKFDLKKMVDNWSHHDADFDLFFQDFKDLCVKFRNRKFESWNEAETIKDWIVPILHMLGWDKETYKDNVSFTYSVSGRPPNTYRPDLLYLDHPDEKDLIVGKKTGDLQVARDLVKMVIEAKAWRHLEKVRHSNCNSKVKIPEDAKLDNSKSLSPEDQLINYQNMLKKDFGILTDGAQWKLLHRLESDGVRKKSFSFNLNAVRLELLHETQEVALEKVVDELKYFFYLFRKQSFYSDTPLSYKLLSSNRKYVNIIIDDMKDNFVSAMTIACNGFLKALGKSSPSDEDLDLIRNTAESHMFNILFIKSCEANEVLPMKIQDYIPYSLTEVINLIEYPNYNPGLPDESEAVSSNLVKVFKNSFNYRPDGTELFDRLLLLYDIIEDGKFGFVIPKFKETVFTEKEKLFSKKFKLNNLTMVKLLFNLGYARIESKYQQIPYNYFSPGQLGSIYESFLEFRLLHAKSDLVWKEGNWQEATLKAKHLRETRLPTITKGEVFFSRDMSEKKKSGSYYTPDFIVRYIVHETLQSLVDERSSDEILQLRVCDPAMGSAHFLNAAVEFLAKSYREKRINESNNDIDESFTESARKVLGSCIYGVDINPRAVKLSKMALWLVTAHAGNHLEPLSNQLICKDSLSDQMKWDSFFDTVEGLKKGIFDAIIGNPPYIGEKGHKKKFDPLKNQRIGRYYQGKMDYFYFFIHLGLDLLKERGRLGFITTNYFLTALGAKNLRKDLNKRSALLKLINLGEWKIFEAAQGQHNLIFTLEKNQSDKDRSVIDTVNFPGKGNLNENEEVFWNLVSNPVEMSNKDVFEGEEFYIRPAVNLNSTGLYEDILRKIGITKSRIGEVFSVNTGIQSGADKLSDAHLKKYPSIKGKKGDGIYVLSRSEANTLKLSKVEASITKPFYKNSDIYKYTTANNSKDIILYLDRTFNAMSSGMVKHLEKYKAILENRREAINKVIDWWQLQWPREQQTFEGPKIVVPQRSKTNTFGFNEIPWYASADVYFITPRDNSTITLKALLGILNSKLLYFWIYHRGKRKGESLELYQKPISEIPLPESIDWNLAKKIELNVNNLLQNGRSRDLEAEIDEIVYKLYGLNSREIKAVDKFYEEKHHLTSKKPTKVS